MTNDLLYHGSIYLQTELMPGFKRSGKFVRWDRIESNHFLYSTTERDSAVGLGLFSAFEKAYEVNRCQFDGKNIIIDSDKPDVAIEDIQKLKVYLYTLPHRETDGWLKNFNPFNNIKTEYKTLQTIQLDQPAEQIDLKKWLTGKTVTFTKEKLVTESLQSPIYFNW